MGRTRENYRNRLKEAEMVRKAEIDSMADRRPDSRATECFRRKPYQVLDVAQYLARKYKIGGDTDGQKDS